MKRKAIVWKTTGGWATHAWDTDTTSLAEDIVAEHPTHAAALAHALAEVGLDRPAEHREAP
ncbi:hypothetical protein DEU31_3032 [Brachybacterium sp. AG952]|uniref:hypothetical protein n=1 Tax=Brachybacterium sp. AG952 TaxID=2183989 RepID=UPI00105C6C70|nr:hypothetical protein [Brachybacterium sp. AG952]TDP76325.1 hypothetical protein DEU31_3032 [Brachybacterium sp. AG952]